MIADSTYAASSQLPSAPIGKRIQFPGLNSIRFYAALAVVVEHVRIQLPGDPSPFNVINLLFVDSQTAVNLFFVLSGFLITYLMFDERITTGSLSISNFYIRRALRILPLYYWVTLIGLVIFPVILGPGYTLAGLPDYRIMLAFGLLPNFASLTAPMIHMWSIGVEEQFYALWPWANRSDGAMLRVCFGILILKLLLTPIIVSFQMPEATILFYSLRFECMAIGALGAYVYAKNHPWKQWIYHPWVQRLALVAFVYLIVFDLPVNTYNSIWTSLVHLILIMNVATNRQSLLKLNFPLTEKLGEISYGMYLYHFPILYLIYFTAYRTGFERAWTSPWLLLTLTVTATCSIAAVSYRWFETPFLNLKKKLVVPTSSGIKPI